MGETLTFLGKSGCTPSLLLRYSTSAMMDKNEVPSRYYEYYPAQLSKAIITDLSDNLCNIDRLSRYSDFKKHLDSNVQAIEFNRRVDPLSRNPETTFRQTLYECIAVMYSWRAL